jgi:hypothetical protein
MALRKCQPIQEHDLKLVLIWEKYVIVLRDYGEKQRCFSAINELLLRW